MSFLIDFVLHIDAHLISIVNTFGDWTYLILFAIIFVETGAVILPFLPGDSLLFAAAALSANSMYHLNIWIFVFLLFLQRSLVIQRIFLSAVQSVMHSLSTTYLGNL